MNRNSVRRWVFARHSHPISAWSRWATTPLLLIPIWTRNWRLAGVLAAWLLLNPVITPTPGDDSAFATKAIRGEEIWMTGRAPDRALTVLSVVGSTGLLAAVVAAWRRSWPVAAAGVAISMAVTLLAWRRYAQIWERRGARR